jgi:galactokinase
MRMDSNLTPCDAPNADVLREANDLFISHFGVSPVVTAYAPGRVEVLGNHTDYNDGFVLSAAIDFGTFFLAGPANGTVCRVMAGDVREEATFSLAGPNDAPPPRGWPDYVRGMAEGLKAHALGLNPFNGLFLGNIPLGAGLSSSAALEMSTGLALAALNGLKIDKLDLARIGQRAEHEYAGVKCGLLDQISSLFGRERGLVLTDFRALDVTTLPFVDRDGNHTDGEVCFLMCNTHASHSLADGAYNSRRMKCEEATAYFATVLNRPVQALRDVTFSDWNHLHEKMDREAALRSAHVIGENERVLTGRDLLAQGHLDDFGTLMFESHRSSQINFDNSCEELDFIVDTAESIPGVLGARLSGGGFGGSAVILLHPRDAEIVQHALSVAYQRRFDTPCDIRIITPSAGARLIRHANHDS